MLFVIFAIVIISDKVLPAECVNCPVSESQMNNLNFGRFHPGAFFVIGRIISNASKIALGPVNLIYGSLIVTHIAKVMQYSTEHAPCGARTHGRRLIGPAL